MTVGQRIKEARKKANMTQSELAEKLGISYLGISQWEIGKRVPRNKALRAIAQALGISVADLLDFSENEKNDVLRIESFLFSIEDRLNHAEQNNVSSEEIKGMEQQLSEEEKKLDIYISAVKTKMQQSEIQHDRGFVPFAQHFSDCIKEDGVELDKLAESLGKQPQEMNKWINGEELPTLDEIEKIAQALGVSVFRLYSWRSEDMEKAIRTEKMLEEQEKKVEAELRDESTEEEIQASENVLSAIKDSLKECHNQGRLAYIMEESAMRADKVRRQMEKESAQSQSQGSPNYNKEKKDVSVKCVPLGRLSNLEEILSVAYQEIGNVMAEIANNIADEERDAGIEALLEAYAKLNVAGRAEALKRIQELQYLPQYQLPTD